MDFYLSSILPFDCVFPPINGLSNALILVSLVRDLFPSAVRLRGLGLLPVLGSFCDCAENVNVGLLYAGASSAIELLPWGASPSACKWLLSFASLGLIAGLGLMVLLRNFWRKRLRLGVTRSVETGA